MGTVAACHAHQSGGDRPLSAGLLQADDERRHLLRWWIAQPQVDRLPNACMEGAPDPDHTAAAHTQMQSTRDCVQLACWTLAYAL